MHIIQNTYVFHNCFIVFFKSIYFYTVGIANIFYVWEIYFVNIGQYYHVFLIPIYPRFCIKYNATKNLKLCKGWLNDSLIEGCLLRGPENYSNFSDSLTEILIMKLNLKQES